MIIIIINPQSLSHKNTTFNQQRSTSVRRSHVPIYKLDSCKSDWTESRKVTLNARPSPCVYHITYQIMCRGVVWPQTRMKCRHAGTIYNTDQLYTWQRSQARDHVTAMNPLGQRSRVLMLVHWDGLEVNVVVHEANGTPQLI